MYNKFFYYLNCPRMSVSKGGQVIYANKPIQGNDIEHCRVNQCGNKIGKALPY